MSPCLRPLAVLALVAAAAPLAACGSLSRVPGVGAGYVSHELCSAAFISGLDPEAYYRESIVPSLGPTEPLITHHVDRRRQEVTATFAGVVMRRAVFRGPLGCVAVHGATAARVTLAASPSTPPALAPIAGPSPVAGAPAIQAAIARAFVETTALPHRNTKAVVIVRNGRVIGERYAPGYGVNTPIQGWSMTKSVTNALIGVLVREGKLDPQDPAPVAAWSSPGDTRHGITVDNLLRMASGLDIGQSLTNDVSTAFDPTSYMVFDTDDMAAFAEKAPLKAPPGSLWRYTNGNTQPLSRIIRDKVGGDPAAVMAFAHRELFDKLGMTGVTLEFDAAGTPIGASHMFATPRDWARFGLLYLNDGVVGGVRILPAGWADYSARQTPHSRDYGYGAGFWTNRGGGPGANYRIGAGMPADAYFARGAQGQVVVIVPSANLIVVRMGYAFTERDDMAVIARLVGDVVASAGAAPGA